MTRIIAPSILAADFNNLGNEIEMINQTKILDERGNLSVIQEMQHIPFDIKRIYWIYDVPGGEVRGSHAFWATNEVIVSLSGSFDVVLHDGINEHRFFLNRSYYGIFVPKMVWRRLENFSTNSLALILASTEYNDQDYIRDFDTFKSMLP